MRRSARTRALRVRVELVGLRQRDSPARRRGRPGDGARVTVRSVETKRGARGLGDAEADAPHALPALRFFTVYGPRQRPEMAITTFLRAILAGKPITMFGDGSMKRDFTHVEDIVRGVVAAVTRARGLPPIQPRLGAPVTFDGLVAAMGRPPRSPRRRPRRRPARRRGRDVRRHHPRATELGWTPRIKLDEGLATVVSWLRTEG